MKPSTFITLLFTLGATAIPAPPEQLSSAEQSLSPFEVDDDHGVYTEDDPADGSTPSTVLLAKRECWYGAQLGCGEKGCWRRCGNDLSRGQWCWTSFSAGANSFISCGNNQDVSRWCRISHPCNYLGCSC
ncbi:hypothetical protein MCOR25_010727 [Pyricularia grisea]|nr:hypothetical protein MCOR25_010727 [Pyricularia grisea]